MTRGIRTAIATTAVLLFLGVGSNRWSKSANAQATTDPKQNADLLNTYLKPAGLEAIQHLPLLLVADQRRTEDQKVLRRTYWLCGA